MVLKYLGDKIKVISTYNGGNLPINLLPLFYKRRWLMVPGQCVHPLVSPLYNLRIIQQIFMTLV